MAIPEILRLPPTPGQAARAAARAEARQAARAEARAALRAAARAEAAWGRRYRRSLGLPARAPRDALPFPGLARPPPKRA